MIIYLLTFFSLCAHSFPKLYDFVRYEANFHQDKIIIEKTIQNQPEVDLFIERQDYFINDQLVETVVIEKTKDLYYTQEKIKNLFENCVRREGAIGNEMIMNTPHKVCEFYHEDSGLTYSFGMVPFGQVRFQVYLGEGEFLDFLLVNFKTSSF